MIYEVFINKIHSEEILHEVRKKSELSNDTSHEFECLPLTGDVTKIIVHSSQRK